jgi:hypothetical protein
MIYQFTLLRRWGVLAKGTKVPTPRDDIDTRFDTSFNEFKNTLRLVLPIAIDRDQNVEFVIGSILKSSLERGSVASIRRMGHYDDIVASG